MMRGSGLIDTVSFASILRATIIRLATQEVLVSRSRYVKEQIAPASVKVGNGRRFHRSDLDTWIRAGGIFAFKKVEGPNAD
jgi:hypothetical protein